ncbi:MAG: EAL domain protein [uncultured Paraburkholderia sp.]|nr:MAG: EAL domain protein [uncultured Paraburkholderia sp.]
MLVHAPALPRHATNNDVLELFNRLPDLHAVAVVERDEPVALINRRSFMDRYALPYHRELFGKRPCLLFANASPVVIEKSMTVEQMAKLLASDDQRYLADGFVITENGKYAGLGTGENLVRAVTEVRIEAARYANPLTFLPGNIPISSHIARLVGNHAGFYACYVDLNHFKPFNDQYGYRQGDEVLKFAAAVLADVCDPMRDFLGHVGGDDFLILFQSDDWRERVLRAIHVFNEGAQRFYAPDDRLAGGIHGEDRRDNPTFFGFVTMAIGCVRVEPDSADGASLYNSEEIASLAALAKRRAKLEASGGERLRADRRGRKRGFAARATRRRRDRELKIKKARPPNAGDSGCLVVFTKRINRRNLLQLRVFTGACRGLFWLFLRYLTLLYNRPDPNTARPPLHGRLLRWRSLFATLRARPAYRSAPSRAL